MITPKEIKTKAEKYYADSFLKNKVLEIPFEKLEIRANKKLNANWNEAQKELLLLVSQSKEKKGFGFSIDYQTIKTKTLSSQTFPKNIYFETERDFLKFIFKQDEVEKFEQNVDLILSTFSILKEWIINNPLKVVKYKNEWQNLLKVCVYFRNNPTPNLYIRELPIPIHTKFIEQNKPILKELLDLLISDFTKEETSFEKRFNLKFQEPLVRFRILDNSISHHFFSGLEDLSVPISDFEKLNLPIKRVIIVENKTSIYTTLTLPKMENTMTIFGSGRSVAILKNTVWLQNVEIFYWGDIDNHGFEMLSQTRNYFSQTKSILMDEETFHRFFENEKGSVSTTTQNLHLTEIEHFFYQKIKNNNSRLEQEKIPLDYVIEVFDREII